MTQRHSPGPCVENEAPRMACGTIYTPWDARVERIDRRSSFWDQGPKQPRRPGLLGRLAYMAILGNA